MNRTWNEYLLFGKWGAENLGSDDDAIIVLYLPFLQLMFILGVIFTVLSDGVEGTVLWHIGDACLWIWVLAGVGVFSILSVMFLFDRIYGIIVAICLLVTRGKLDVSKR